MEIAEMDKSVQNELAALTDIILDTLRAHIENRQAVFVFPTEAAAQRWRHKGPQLLARRSLEAGRFIAWDRFKETISGRGKCVTPVLRRLFAEDLARRNREAAAGEKSAGAGSAGLPFRYLIPPKYAELGSSFAQELAAFLPGLKLLAKKMRESEENSQAGTSERAASSADFIEHEDIYTLERLYAPFLAEHNLVEPAWNSVKKPDAPEGGKNPEYYVFFPAVLAEAEEYEALFSLPNIHSVNLPDKWVGGGTLRVYKNFAQEIRGAVLRLREAHDAEGVSWTDMAVSVCNLDEYYPYLAREMRLYDVPHRRRSGSPLAAQGPAVFFNMANECARSDFSFEKTKSFLLSNAIPWENPSRNTQLFEFGVKHNCVCAWKDDGSLKDAWEEAFTLAKNGIKEETDAETRDLLLRHYETLRKYYLALRGGIRAIVRAKSFSGIRAAYFKFRDTFLDMERLSEADNNILARCVEELSELAALENDYQNIMSESPFAFFLDVLKKKRYVPQPEKTGVSVYEYENAAAAPFTLHLVLNVREGSAQVVRKKHPFLRLHTKERLGIEDSDVSEAYFRLYEEGGGVVFSCAEQSPSGWGVPHSFFAKTTIDAGEGLSKYAKNDPFAREREWWQQEAGVNGAAFPAYLHPAQKQGFENWARFLREKNSGFSLFAEDWKPAKMTVDAITLRISARRRNDEAHPGLLKVSATGDLNVFFECRLKWLFAQIFRVDKYETGAKLHDPRSLGTFYHQALRLLFSRIQSDGPFDGQKLPLYETYLAECVNEAMQKTPPLPGPLALPLRSVLSSSSAKKLLDVVEAEAVHFNGLRVKYLEKELHLVRGSLLVHGVIDRASISGEKRVVIDYKSSTNNYSRTKASVTEDGVIADFQLPVYVHLFEENSGGEKVSGAYYLGINNCKLVKVVEDGSKSAGRGEFQPTLDAFDSFADKFGQAVTALDFNTAETKPQTCQSCVFKTICRKTYNLNAGKNERLSLAQIEDTDYFNEDDYE